MVCSVKCSESGMIVDLVILFIIVIVGDVEVLMCWFKIGGILIVNEKNQLIGIFINCDFCFEENMQVLIIILMMVENLIIVLVGIILDQVWEIL